MESLSTRTPDRLQLAAAFVGLVAATSSLEGIWYLDVAEDIYHQHIGVLMNLQFDALVAVLFYLFYSLGALIFAVGPALHKTSLRHALLMGGLYGFFCFSAHNLTDLADVKGYNWQITLIDITWGTAMTAVASGLSYRLARCLQRAPRMKEPGALA